MVIDAAALEALHALFKLTSWIWAESAESLMRAEPDGVFFMNK
jgi:hypothetical protein